MTCNVALRARRSTARRDAHELAAGEQSKHFVEAPNQTQALIDSELNNLGAKYRDPIVLCHLVGHRPKDTAHLLGCSYAALKKRLTRGRAMLRERLEAQGIVLPAAGLSAVFLFGQEAVSREGISALSNSVLAILFGKVEVSARVAGLIKGGLQAMFLQQLRFASFVLFGILSFGAVGFMSMAGFSAEANGTQSGGLGKEDEEPKKTPEKKAEEPAKTVDMDTALAKKITLKVTAKPLKDVCRTVSKTAGVPITCDPAVENNPITMTLNDMTVDLSMKWIATMAGARVKILDDKIRLVEDKTKVKPKN